MKDEFFVKSYEVLGLILLASGIFFWVLGLYTDEWAAGILGILFLITLGILFLILTIVSVIRENYNQTIIRIETLEQKTEGIK